MKVVVTGSAGRVGRAVFVRLARQHQIVGNDRQPASTVHQVGDVTDGAMLAGAAVGAAAIVHVAALHAPHVGVLPEAEFERVNVAGTAAVVAAAREAGVPRVVFTSTTAVFGDAATPDWRAGWVDDAVEPRPVTVYHRTKLAAEALLRESASTGGPEVRIVRMSRCFPEPAPVMAVFRLHRGIDARDVAEAHALALDDPGPRHTTWTVSGATPFRPEDAEGLWQDAPAVLRERAPALVTAFEDRGWRLPQRIDRVYVPSPALNELGWIPRYGFDEVLSMLDQGLAEVLPLPVNGSAGERRQE